MIEILKDNQNNQKKNLQNAITKHVYTETCFIISFNKLIEYGESN